MDVLALTRAKGLGDDGLAKLLDQIRREGGEPAGLFQASATHLREHFALRSETAETIRREAPRLAQEGEELYRKLQSLGASVLLPATAEYPERLESFYGSASPVLYSYGNHALLASECFAIVSSSSPSAESLGYTFALANRLAEAGKTLLTSPETPTYNLVGLGGKLAGAQRIVVLHRGLFDFLDGESAREPLPLARRAGGGIDAHATLLLSPFRPAGRWQKGNGPRRDQLLVALADTVVAMEVKRGGRMEPLCLKAHAAGRRLFACQFALSPAANEALLAAGATPLAPDDAGSNVDLLLRDDAATLTAAAKADDLPRRRALGQYFTPPPVAKFIWDALELLALPERIAPTARVIDPACGEGVFLRAAVERGYDPAALVGVDLDEHLLPRWQADSLLNRAGLFRANGLVDSRAIGLEKTSFDVVIGNPPFAGQGLKQLLRLVEGPPAARGKSQLNLLGSQTAAQQTHDTERLPQHERAILDSLVRHLSKYVCWRMRESDDNGDVAAENSAAGGLFAELELPTNRAARPDDYATMAKMIAEWSASRPLDLAQPALKNTIRRLASTAIEVYFLERFIALAKPGGLMALIVPESVLANDRLTPFRRWLLGQVVVLAVIALPQKVFTGVGANARTCVFFGRRYTTAQQLAALTVEPMYNCRVPADVAASQLFMISPRPQDEDYSLEGYFATILEAIGKQRGLMSGERAANK